MAAEIARKQAPIANVRPPIEPSEPTAASRVEHLGMGRICRPHGSIEETARRGQMRRLPLIQRSRGIDRLDRKILKSGSS